MGKGSFKYAWVLDKLKADVNVVSLLISLCGNLRLPNTMSPSLMPLDIVISSRTRSLELHRLIVLFSS